MPDTPRVLLLGDSIRMSYQPHVAGLLDGRAHVVGPADSGQYSLFTLSSLNRWIDELGTPDIVHWNNGFHDVGHNPTRYPVQIPIDMYQANLAFIFERLREMTSQVIWANTTPVYPDRPISETEWSWRNEEIDQYNDVARKLMETHDVPINDLHTLVWDNVDEFLSEDQIHLSEAGQKACANAVAEFVSRLLT